MYFLAFIFAIAADDAGNGSKCSSGPPPACTVLTDCIRLFESTAHPTFYTGGLDPDALALSAGFEGLQPPPVAELVRLLDHADRRSRDIAAHALGRLRARSAVPALVRHLDDTGWASWALGTIADPVAIPPLIDRLEKMDGAGEALTRIGVLGIEAIAVALVKPRTVEQRRGAVYALTTMTDDDDDVSRALPILRRSLPTADSELQREILAVARALGPKAAMLIPDVRSLRRAASGPDERASLDELLVRLGDSEPVAELAKRMWTDSTSTHMALADLGSRAAGAVPMLIDVLEHGSWSQMGDAAHALGLIGDERACHGLVAALDVPSWRVNNEAARALGRIGARAVQGIERLERLRDDHWSKVVRAAAATALRRIRGERVPDLGAHGTTQVVADHRADGGEDHGLTCEPAYAPSTGLEQPPRRQVKLGAQWRELDASFVPMSETKEPLPPSVVLPPLAVPPNNVVFGVENGWLVARDAGEWGGDILFVRSDGVVEKVFSGNSHGFVRLDGALFALTGLAHMGLDGGELVRLVPEGTSWRSKPVVELPHAPYGFRKHVSGLHEEVLVLSDDPALVSADGDIALVACRLIK